MNLKSANTELSPQAKARLGGFCWFACFATSAFALSVATKLIVARDPTATAANLLANEALYQTSTAALLVSGAF